MEVLLSKLRALFSIALSAVTLCKFSGQSALVYIVTFLLKSRGLNRMRRNRCGWLIPLLKVGNTGAYSSFCGLGLLLRDFVVRLLFGSYWF